MERVLALSPLSPLTLQALPCLSSPPSPSHRLHPWGSGTPTGGGGGGWGGGGGRVKVGCGGGGVGHLGVVGRVRWACKHTPLVRRHLSHTPPRTPTHFIHTRSPTN